MLKSHYILKLILNDNLLDNLSYQTFFRCKSWQIRHTSRNILQSSSRNLFQIFRCHRIFLAMASPVFEAMFFGGLAEKENHVIKILDVQPEAFRVMLE